MATTRYRTSAASADSCFRRLRPGWDSPCAVSCQIRIAPLGDVRRRKITMEVGSAHKDLFALISGKSIHHFEPIHRSPNDLTKPHGRHRRQYLENPDPRGGIPQFDRRFSGNVCCSPFDRFVPLLQTTRVWKQL